MMNRFAPFILIGFLIVLALGIERGDGGRILAREPGASVHAEVPLPADYAERWWIERQQRATPRISARRGDGRTLFVDINAAPDGDGSQARPFRTITDAGAVATFEGGVDAIAVAPGEYREDLPIPAGVHLYAVDSYTNTLIIGNLHLSNQSTLENFTVQIRDFIGGYAFNPALIGNYFKATNANSRVAMGMIDGIVALNLFEVPFEATGAAFLFDNGFAKGGRLNYQGEGASLFEGNLLLGGFTLRESDQWIGIDRALTLSNNWFINGTLHLEPFQGGQRTIRVLNNHFLNTGVHETIYAASHQLVMENNIFGYTQYALYFSSGNIPTLRNNLFYGNGLNLSHGPDPVGSNGNIGDDPKFVDLNGGDFRLSADSPAIDRGGAVALVRDYEGDPRPCDGDGDGVALFDIGGDEYSGRGGCLVTTPTPLPSYTPTPTPTVTPTFLPSTPTGTPTSTWTPSATPTATVTPTATAEGCRQLLTEPSFELDQGWTFIGNDYDTSAVRTQSGAVTGSWAAQIRHSSANGQPAYVQQPVRLPAGQATLDLNFTIYVQEGVENPTVHRAELVDPASGNVLATLWETPKTSSGWQAVQVIFVWPQQQDLILRIGGVGTANGFVTTTIDDVLLSHCAPAGQPTVTATATTTPLVSATATRTPIAANCLQLLTDPSFETVSPAWQIRRDDNEHVAYMGAPPSLYEGSIGLTMSYSPQASPGSAFYVEQALRLPAGPLTFDIHWLRTLNNPFGHPKGIVPTIRAELVDVSSGEVLEVLWTAPEHESRLLIWETDQFHFTNMQEVDVILRIGGLAINADTDTYLYLWFDDIRLTTCAGDGPTITPTPSPTKTPPPTWTPTSTPTPPGSLPGCTQLLHNSEFWSFQPGWTATGEAGFRPDLNFISEPTVGMIPLRPAQHGIASALAQTVTIPNGEAHLSIHTRMETERESAPLQSYQIQIRSADGSEILATLISLDAAHNWIKHVFDLNSFVGQNVQIWIGGVPSSDAEPTRLIVDDAYLQVCGAETGEAIYLPQIAKQPAPSPTPTSTPTATATPTPPTLVTAPDTLSGAPLQVVSQTIDWVTYSWYRSPDRKLVPGEGVDDPFPLTDTLKINAIDRGRIGLVAATDMGIYARDGSTGQWAQISETAATQIIASRYMTNELWIAPADTPQQIWRSLDGGQTWADQSAGLVGTVVGPLLTDTNYDFNLLVATIRDNRYVIWEKRDAADWIELATVPAAAISYTPGGLPASMAFWFVAEPIVWAGSSDGNLYVISLADENPTWEIAHAFGAGSYPLLLNSHELSLIDLSTGAMTFYRWQGPLFEGSWEPAPSPLP